MSSLSSVQVCLRWPCVQRRYPASPRASSSSCANGLLLGPCEYANESPFIYIYNRTFSRKELCYYLFNLDSMVFSSPLQELGLIRKPASFMTSICDERGQELIYAGMPITEVFKSEMGLGGTLGLLWFQRRSVGWPLSQIPLINKLRKPHHRCHQVFLSVVFRLPRYACQFIEMCLMVTADHGPAVSGAHNTIVCARAGKDLISSLTSGLLTIVSRHSFLWRMSSLY